MQSWIKNSSIQILFICVPVESALNVVLCHIPLPRFVIGVVTK